MIDAAMRKDTDLGLEERVARLGCWSAPVTMARLEGGLTNVSFRVQHRGEEFVARCGDDIPVHHIFRDRERAAGTAAFQAGLSPEIVHAEPGIQVLRFIEGRTFVEADLRTDPKRLAALLRRVHAEVGRRLRGPANAFWVFQVIRDYVACIGADPAYLVGVDRLEAAQVPLPIVYGHNDLLPGNLIDDGQRLWLIDWEYGGFGTGLFDLANLSANGAYDAAADAVLLDAYFEGKVDDALRRAFAAMKAASALREALWAMVSDVHLRRPGIDYTAHAREYLGRFAALSKDL